MLNMKHIHRPALVRYTNHKFKSQLGVTYTKKGSTYTINKFGTQIDAVNTFRNQDVFDHKIMFDRLEQPWFNGKGCGRLSREYATEQDHQMLVSREIKKYRNFSSFPTKVDFLDYYAEQKDDERTLYEVIPPNKPCLLFFDHDEKQGVDQLHRHNQQVRATSELLFDLLEIPRQQPVLLSNHRTKGSDPYLSTHQRFPTVSIESCNGTMKAILHLLKHTEQPLAGLDLGVHSSYQQLRVPGSHKYGSKKSLQPSDGSDLDEILLVSCIEPREIHITTSMVKEVLETKFGCDGSCCSLDEVSVDLPESEEKRLTLEIAAIYSNFTGIANPGIAYRGGTLWQVPHTAQCIHGERHKSNRGFVIVRNKTVMCQCQGRCKQDKPYVTIGHLAGKLSTTPWVWEQTPSKCYDATVAIDIMTRLEPGVDLYQLAMILACIGDFKDLLAAYSDQDSASMAWSQATHTLSNQDELQSPYQAIKTLGQFLVYTPEAVLGKAKRKRKLSMVGDQHFQFIFDFGRFNKEHPHPLAINTFKAGSMQTVNMRYLDDSVLDLTKRGILLHSEMGTAKTSNVLLNMITGLPTGSRVLICTPKRLFAKSIQGVLKRAGLLFDHYRDLDFFKKDHSMVIVELESMHKMSKAEFAPYDLVILDESETILTQMLCLSTHRHNLRSNWETLEWVIERCSQCLFADARMSAITMDYASDVLPRNEIHYIHNICKIPMDVMLFEDTKLMDNVLLESLDRDETLFTFSGTRNKCLHLNKLTEGIFGEERTAMYSSLNSGKLQDDLVNVNETWKDLKAIHCTPSITVGTSFDVPDVIDNIYLYLFSLTASPKDAMQSARRVRKPTKSVLNITVSGPQHSQVPISRHRIRKIFQERRSVFLSMETERLAKDFQDDQDLLQRLQDQLDVGGVSENPTLINNAANVTLERNLNIRCYKEELCRILYSMGYCITIVRGDTNKDKLVPKSIVPEEKVFDEMHGASGIISHYELNESELEERERNEELSEDEVALVNMARYIKNFSEEAWGEITYEYWKNYRYKLGKDKRLQMVLMGDLDNAVEESERGVRYEIAKAEGDLPEERHGTTHTACVPELIRTRAQTYAKPLFGIFNVLGLKESRKTTSTVIKENAVALAESLRSARALLGVSHWKGRELPAAPTYRQIVGFTVRMLDVLVDGSLTKTGAKRKRIAETIMTKDSRRKLGATTRAKRVKVTSYELQFDADQEGGFTALDRIKHLVKLDQ